MFKCILGERNSGKSIFIENQVKKADGNTLYVATLPELKMYKETICRHQKRRPSSWKCVELFKMSEEEILTYSYQNYKYVILDNLSYFILFNLYFYKNKFIPKCDERIISLIDKIARDNGTVVYFVDSPIRQNLYENESRVVQRIVVTILDKAAVIERFYNKDMICRVTVEEAKDYLFNT